MSVGNILFDDMGAAIQTAMTSVDYFDDVIGGTLALSNLQIMYWPKLRGFDTGVLGQVRIVPEDYEVERALVGSKFGVFSYLIIFDFADEENRGTKSVGALQALQRLFDDQGIALLNTYFVDNGVVDGNGNKNRLGMGGDVTLDPEPLMPADEKKVSVRSVAYRMDVRMWHRQNLR